MTRRVTTFVLLIVLALGSTLVAARVLAQDGEEVPVGHPLVGSWLITFPDVPGTPPSLYTFDADGTVVGSSATGARHGGWEATGDRSGAFTVLGLAGEGPAAFRELVELRGTVDVDETGDGFALTYFAAPILPDGTSLPSEGPFTAAGERIEVDRLAVPGTPAPSEATPAAGATPAGTPLVDETIATALATALP